MPLRKVAFSPNILEGIQVSAKQDLEKFRQGTSTVASVVSFVGPMTDGSLSYWASTIMYNTVGMTQRVARVRLRQLRLVWQYLHRSKPNAESV